MVKFISDNFINCITLMFAVLGFVIGLKLKSHDKKLIGEYKKNLAKISILSRNKMLFGSKFFKISYLVTVIIFTAVIYCRLENLMTTFIAVITAILLSLLTAFIFIELILAISVILRKLIAVNSVLLNVLFSSVIIMLVLNYVNTKLVQSFGKAEFILSFVCLGICYIFTVVILIKLLNEASEDNSRLTVVNIWKSAVLTIALFIMVLSLMSVNCYMYDANSFKGTNGGIIDMVYYIVITFATVGYGDITPVSVVAKGISILTVVTYILAITVLLSEIVGLKRKKND